MTLSTRRRWALLATVGAGLLLITLDNSILYTALPTLTRDLGASSTESLWIINAYPLVMAGLLLGAGTLGDRVGHTRMFVSGLSLFGIASVVAAFSPTPLVLITARALLAVGAAAMMPATLALIRTNFDDERERNIAVSIWGSISVVGIAFGPIIAGSLLELFWWGSVFLINVPVVIATMIATAIIRPANDPDPTKRWDVISSAQILVALVGTVVAIKEIGHAPPSPLVVIIGLLAGIVGYFFFARRQSRLNDPLLDFAIFRNNAFLAGVLAAAFSLFAIGGLQLATTQRFQLVAGFTPLQAGLLVAAVAVGTLPTALIAGAYLHRIGLLILIGGGLAISVIGLAVTLTGFYNSLILFIAGLAVTGAGLGSVMAVASSSIVGNAPRRRAGMASSVEEVSYEFGSLTAVAILGSLLTAIYTATVDLPAGAPAAARESIAAALASADGNQAIIDAAHTAYDTSYVVVLIVIAVALAVGVLVAGRLLRQYGPGTQSQAHSGH